MPRTILLLVLLCIAVPIVAMPQKAVAAEKILDATIDRYMNEASKWEPRLKQAAKTMFWILATISMVFTFAFMFIKGNTSLGDFFGEFLRFIVTTGFFYWLLNNGSEIAKAIIQSFGMLGLQASSTYQSDLSPSNLLSFALDLIARSCASFGEQDVATSVIALLLSIAIAILFAIIAAMMVLLLCSAWVLVYAGIIYLGFGGGKWTSDIAINYFKTVLGLAMQTFTFCLLVGIGQQQIERLLIESQQSKSVTVKGYVFWDSTINTTAMTITEGCIILIFTIVLFMLVKTVPNIVAGVISGSSTGGIQMGGSGGAAAAAAAITSGGAMIAMQAAGAGMAMASAYSQTKEHMSNSEGMFKNAMGGGGLSAAMDMGLRTAGDFMSNLVSGASGSAKESLQENTAGGSVSANIDANREEEDKAREAAKQGNDGGGLSGDMGGGEGGGGDTPGDPGGGSAPSGGGSGGDVGGGGRAGSGAPDGSGASSSPMGGSGESSSGDGDTGLDWGGSLSGDTGQSSFDKEWNESLKSYDPKKVGLVEE